MDTSLTTKKRCGSTYLQGGVSSTADCQGSANERMIEVKVQKLQFESSSLLKVFSLLWPFVLWVASAILSISFSLSLSFCHALGLLNATQ